MRHLVEEAGLSAAIAVESAGTAAWHVGKLPDDRSRATARRRGIDLASRARRFVSGDFARFDYVLAMDAENERALLELAPDLAFRDRIHRLRDFDPSAPRERDVPDPYYGGPRGFEHVFDLCEAACRGLLDHLRRNHGIRA